MRPLKTYCPDCGVRVDLSLNVFLQVWLAFMGVGYVTSIFWPKFEKSGIDSSKVVHLPNPSEFLDTFYEFLGFIFLFVTLIFFTELYLRLTGQRLLELRHPYELRTRIRSRLPWFLINIGVAAKKENCENVGGLHKWYNLDGKNSACYHCQVIKPGQLWETE